MFLLGKELKMMRDTAVSRRTILAFGGSVVGAAGLAACPAESVAQATYPTRPVRVIVPYSAGGGADAIARVLFARLSETLGQQFVIENRGGAGGTLGAGAVAKAEPDGYTLLHDATGFAINPTLFPRLSYDARKDFTPTFLAGTLPLLLVVHPSVPARTTAEVIALAESTPGGLDWASAGNGSLQHLAMEMFAGKAGVKVNHVPYKGGAPALNDVVAGHVKFYFSNTAAVSSQVQAGTVRAVAHTSDAPVAAFPELPPVADALPGFRALEWNGVFLPARTPASIVERLNGALNDAIRHPEVARKLAGLTVETRPNSAADFTQFVEAELGRWGEVVRTGNIRPE